MMAEPKRLDDDDWFIANKESRHKDKSHDRRRHRKAESESDSSSSSSSSDDESRAEKKPRRSRKDLKERESSSQRVSKKSKRRSRTPSMSPPPRKKDRPAKEEVAEKKPKKDAHRHRNYRRKSRERQQEKAVQSSRDRSRSKDRPSGSNKRRDRSQSRDRKRQQSNRDRSNERLEKSKDNRPRQSNNRKDRRSRSKEKDRPHQKRAEKEVMPKLKSPEATTVSNPNKESQGEKKRDIGVVLQSLAKATLPGNTNTVQTHPLTAKPNIPVAGPSVTNAPAVELPSYYNAAAINVTKYTTQIQKRKLLWSNKSVDQNAAKWQQTAQFAKDEDGKVASKFMRLMGIKNAAPPATAGGEEKQKQADMLSSMEQQYEVARQATHTMRGMGLGFSRQF